LLLNPTHSNESPQAFKNDAIQLIFRNMVCHMHWNIHHPEKKMAFTPSPDDFYGKHNLNTGYTKPVCKLPLW
jgi:hypothetical protein